MNDNEHFDRLQAELASLTKQLQSLGVQDPNNPKDWITAQQTTPTEADPNDVADRVEAYDTNRSILAELETRFNNVQIALEQITKGTHTICTVCGTTIEPDRLNANPAASTCITHADTNQS